MIWAFWKTALLRQRAIVPGWQEQVCVGVGHVRAIPTSFFEIGKFAGALVFVRLKRGRFNPQVIRALA